MDAVADRTPTVGEAVPPAVAPPSPPREGPRRWRFDVHQYHRLAEAGILAPDARVELIDGEVIEMAPMGTRHRTALVRLDDALRSAVAGHRIQVMNQVPLRLSDGAEPEPDLLLLPKRDDDYADVVLAPHHTLLVIEISDTTLDHDLNVKAPLYARAGVPELWVIDLPNRRLHAFSAPEGGLWTRVHVHTAPARLPLPGVEGAQADFSGVFPAAA
jgi:Uma2 family endonuclease